MKNKFTVLCLASLAAPFVLMASTVEERLAELEGKVEALAAENAVLRKELGYNKEGKAPALVLGSGKASKLVLGGFMHANAEFGEAPDSRWTGIKDRIFLRRARVNLAATLAHGFSAKIEMDLGANTLGASSGFRAQMTDGYLQWQNSPEFVLRVGQFKTPFGYEQLASDTKTYTVERSLPNDRLTISRQIGVGVSGDLAAKRISYALGVFNGTGVNTSTNDNDDMLYVGRLSGLAYSGKTQGGAKVSWSAGVNAYTGEMTGSFTGTREGLGVDTQVVFGPAEVWAEWLQRKDKASSGSTTKSEGYSVLGVWKFMPELHGMVRYESYDSNTAVGATTTELWTLGLAYLIKGDDLKLTVNYLLGDQPGSTADGDRLLARMQVMF